MTRPRLLALCLLAAGGARDSHAEMLPTWDLEWVCLRARSIVEARRVEPGVVEVLKVHRGDARVGERLKLQRFEDLPRRAFDEVPWFEEHGKGTPLDGCTAVLFLERVGSGRAAEPAAEERWEPVGWGSGVKWIVGDRVFGHCQPINPGGYVLVPDPEATALGDLRDRIAAELRRRQEFESNLVLLKPEERACALLPFVFRTPRDAYSSAAQELLLQIGDAAGDVLVREAETATTGERRQLLAELLGRLRFGGGAGFIGGLFDEQMAHVRKLPEAPSREQLDALYRWQGTVYWLAETARPWNGARPRLISALRWAVARRDPEVLDAAARGLARAPDPANVQVLAKALEEWPTGGEGQVAVENHLARRHLVESIGEHRLPACVPVLAGILGDPDPELADAARSCLEEIVGEDLGERPGPWLDWLRGLAAPEAPPK